MYSISRLALSILLLILSAVSGIEAQNEVCLEPNAIVFDDFEFTTAEDLKDRISAFEQKVSELKSAKGIIAVFAGAQAKIDSESILIKKVEGYSRIAGSSYNSTIWSRFGGYRLKESYVLILRPMDCSSYNMPLADLSVDKVQFEGFRPESTIRHSGTDLMRGVIDPIAKACPPAARAVRACSDDTKVEVYVLVDHKGDVAFASAINAHPLLRAAAAVGVKTWKFIPKSIDGNSMNQSGIVIISFEEGPGISSNE